MRCSNCARPNLTQADFYPNPKGRTGFRSECKCCWKERNSQHYGTHSQNIKQGVAKWRAKNPGIHNKHNRNARWRLKEDLLRIYSKGTMICACCMIGIVQFLAIDHIEGGGNAHRKKISGGRSAGTDHFYYWLRNENYPPGYQVLCHNCNFAKSAYGICPHELVRRVMAA